MTVVIDASLLVRVLLGGSTGAPARSALVGHDLHAPELIDLEVTSALRRLVLRGLVPLARASEAVADLTETPLARYPHRPMLPRVWELRPNLTAYDAAYAALAETLGCELVTGDGGLASAAGPRCPRRHVP